MVSRTQVFQLRNFSVTRGNRAVIQSLSLNFYSGEVVCVLGPNGSGKSSLLAALAGALPYAKGSLNLHDKDPAALDPSAHAKEIAYLPQHLEVPMGFTVSEVVAFGLAPHQSNMRATSPAEHAELEAVLSRWDLAEARGQLVSSMSGGEQQRVHLARIEAQKTPIVILDEPSSSLDLKHASDLYTRLSARSTERSLMLYATHDLTLGPHHATRVLVLANGQLKADGTWEDILKTDALSEAFGIKLSAGHIAGIPTVVPVR
jgi:ABC-type cobalamin/Fe3+-siderophores transport system ATPase subunit